MTARGSFAIAALALHAVVVPLPALAQADRVPSAVSPVPYSSPLISRKSAVTVGLLFGAAMLGDREIREEAQEFRGGTTNSFARIGNSFGEWTVIVPALSAGYLAGVISGSDDFKRVMFHAGAAALLATGVSSSIKYTIGRTRPDFAGDPDQFRPFSGSNSFPSGHTAVAFALATSFADETDDGWSDYLFYGAAALTAASRINDDRHWASDVFIGGLIGHLSAKWVTKQMGPVRLSPAGVTVNLQF